MFAFQRGWNAHFSAIKEASFFGVVVGAVASGITAKGPNGGVMDLGAGLPDRLKKLPAAEEGVLDAMVVGEGWVKILVVMGAIDEDLWPSHKVGVTGVTG